jgi:hypothetical protein
MAKTVPHVILNGQFAEELISLHFSSCLLSHIEGCYLGL